MFDPLSDGKSVSCGTDGILKVGIKSVVDVTRVRQKRRDLCGDSALLHVHVPHVQRGGRFVGAVI